MKIADILGLRQREELRPRQRQRILDEPADFELARLDGDVRVLAKIHHGPVPHFALSDRQLRHAVPVRLTGPRRLATGEFDVDRALVERDLPVDIFLTAFDEVVLRHVSLQPRYSCQDSYLNRRSDRTVEDCRHGRGLYWDVRHAAPRAGTDGAKRVTVSDRRHLEVYHNSYHHSQISTLRMALSVRF